MSDDPLTILHVAANRWWTGSADPVIRTARALEGRGHRVLLGVIPGDRFEAKAREAGLTLVEGLALRPHVAPLEHARDVRRLRDVVRERDVDLVHAHHSHDHWLALLARAPRADGRRPAVVRTFHNLRAVRRGPGARLVYRRTAAAFAVSAEIARRCRDAGFPAARVVPVPGLADLERFDARADGRAIREEFRLGDAPVVVSVARLAPNRGHELLLSAFGHLRTRLPRARLLLVGKGEARAQLERLVGELGLADAVVFTGYRDRDLPEVLAAADCFTLMGAGSDDSCRAALEAMAAARPVVARRVAALPETVAHGETGLLVDDDRPESIAAALAAVLDDRVRGAAMGAAGRRRAECEFAPERTASVVESVYRSLLEAAS